MGKREPRDGSFGPFMRGEMGIRSSARGRLALPAVAASTLAIVAVAGIAAWHWMHTGRRPGAKREEERGPTEAAHSIAKAPARPRPVHPGKGGEWGRFEVPALKMSWTVLEGTDDVTLDRGIGLIEGTAGFG
jgi:hypothetical protein